MAEIHLYYLGGLHPSTRKVTYVMGREIPLLLPPVGEALVVEDYIADALLRKYKVADQFGNPVDAFTTDERLAQVVKAGGPIPPAVPATAAQSFTRAQLEAMLAAKIAAEAQGAASEEPPPPPAPSGKSKKGQPAPSEEKKGE